MTTTGKNAPAPAGRTDYWRSLEDLAQTPEFREHMEKEFPSFFDQLADPVSRRSFLGLMGASIALSGLVGCRRPLAKILPYSKLPEDLLPGVPQAYASVWTFRGAGDGILVTSNEGRPTKIEGNPGHPSSLGATHTFAQAAVLDLYDPDRSRFPLEKGTRRSWDEFSAAIGPKLQALRGNGGDGLRFLAEATASPTARALRDRVQAAFPRARWHVYEPVHRDNVVAGSRLAFGRPLRTQLHLDQADVVLALDSDFLYAEPNSVRHARDFARRRRVAAPGDTMNRLYVVEPAFSITGAKADHRLRLSRSEAGEFLRALAATLGSNHGVNVPDLGAVSAPPRAKAWLAPLAKDLAAHRGRGVILAGSGQPPEVHALVHALNRALGNVGTVVRYTTEPLPGDGVASIRDLAQAMDRGEVTTLFVLGGNPAFDAPGDLDFARKLGKVGTTVRLGLHEDETSAASGWHLPMAHFLETWGDAEAWDGTRSIQQPLIAPLYEGKSEIELLALLLGSAETDGHALVQATYAASWGSLTGGDKWNRALNDGVIPDTASAEVPAAPDGGAIASAWRGRAAPAAEAGLEGVFIPDYSMWDGRFANNPWLQELPDPMTKMVWDNAAMIAPRTAKDLGIDTGDLVEVAAGGKTATVVACVTPGIAEKTVILPLGYGRSRSGRVGTGVGFDVQTIRASGAMDSAPVTLARTGEHYRVVRTQDHQTMDGRPLVREGTLDEFEKEPEFAREMQEVPPDITLYTNREYDYSKGDQWGMTIDLNTCIGCNACTMACTSENNVTVVGKDQVSRGREMHWIRLDRYYRGDIEDPEAVHQPIPCMQCENAPCETVCPVNATNHSSDGLNQMIYNRCIGTRYCNNNCPYKVRRFNYYAWWHRMGLQEVQKMQMNPDVTVRMRGVMEKCTYCIQRINRAKIDATNERRPIRDGEIVTACQQVCPTESIVFGNIRDAESRVAKLKAEPRNYTMLPQINTRPRTSYLAGLRNPNPEMEHLS